MIFEESDEKKFKIMNTRRRVIAYKRSNQCYHLKFFKPSVKYSGGSNDMGLFQSSWGWGTPGYR
jgi:hypothetical protein